MRQALVHTLLAILGGFVVWMIVPPGRANADPVPMYCWLGYTRQSCAEFPIVTHWVADSGGGGFEQLDGTHADPRRLTEPELRYGHYSGMTTDTYAPADWEVINFINRVEEVLGCNKPEPDPKCVPLKLYNYDSESALNKLQPGLNKIQIIHNVRIPVLPLQTSLFTFIFPAGWQPTQRYPILLVGNGSTFSNNYYVFVDYHVLEVARYVGQSTQNGGTGLIAAFSNTGGREGAGWHDKALNDVADMLRFMEPYGVDRSRVVNYGASRGGGTAMLWAENFLHGNEYTSIGVFAMEPPSHGGFLTQQALASYQGLHLVATNFFNDQGADRYGPGQKIDLNPDPLMGLLLDQPDPWKADRPQEDYPSDTWRKSPSGYLSRLANKTVVLSIGDHDAYIPFPMILKADRTLRDRWAIPHLTCVTLRTGHSVDIEDCARPELEGFLLAQVTGQPYPPPTTSSRRYFIATDLSNHAKDTARELPNQTTLPFSITVPYRLTTVSAGSLAQWATLAACGQTGKPYSATLTRQDNGQVVYTTGVKTFGTDTFVDFDFDGLSSMEVDSECDVIRLDQQPGWSALSPGIYRWSFTFNGRTIDPGNLSYFGDMGWGRPPVATTIIDSAQPFSQEAIFDRGGTITMGVSEF